MNKTKQPTDFREKISEILVKWSMPTRQAAINEIISAVSELVEECIGEDENLYEKERKTGKFDWRVERETGSNEAKAEIRQRFKEKLKYARNKQQAS